ncbi:MAG: alpha-galactosidase [Clostridiales bacterium]|nr:alpha-galactosidase [Clostridiales bacterium]
MAVKRLQEYQLGDMLACYDLEEESGKISFYLIPENMKALLWNQKRQGIDSLIQVKLAGDVYNGAYSGGMTLRQSESVNQFRFKEQKVWFENDKKTICTILQDDRGYRMNHMLEWHPNAKAVEIYSQFYNDSTKRVKLELLSSFSMGGLTPFTKEDAAETLYIHRIRSVWSMEGRLETMSFEDLQLEPSWANHGVRCERFGQAGSMPVNRYFPYLVLEDRKNEVFWGAQIAHNASWQMEIYRKDDGVAISGGLADREFGHWMKEVLPQQSFRTPKAIVSVCKGKSVDIISQRLTSLVEYDLANAPLIEQDLPIVFNEYCTTWGNPSHENIKKIIEAIKDKNFAYFVIDCGWYKEEGIPWDISMGDYEVSKELFPDGLEKTVEEIKNAGMKPGIWFEIENVGMAAKAYKMESHLLKRDGTTLTTSMRRFWDMKDPWVEEYLSKKVIGLLKKYEFSYMKMDYNDTIGIGCDGAESLGEGLRQNMEASYRFIQKIKEEIPEIVLENCASGGHRLEPLMMSACSMASFSDAHECPEIPIIAANLHRVILPRQSQIWAVIRKEDTKKRVTYSIANTFLGRMCLSGDVVELSEEQWQQIDAGMAFYKKIAPMIRDGFTDWFGNEIKSYRHPKGWQGILRTGKEDAYALFHIFEQKEGEVYEISIPKEYTYRVDEIYSDTKVEVQLENYRLSLVTNEEWKAVAVYLKSIDFTIPASFSGDPMV